MKPFFNQTIEEALKQFKVSSEKGLSSAEAKKKLEEVGPNQLISKKQKSIAVMFFEQFKSSMVVIYLLPLLFRRLSV